MWVVTELNDSFPVWLNLERSSFIISECTNTQTHTHTKLSVCIHINHYSLISVTYHPFVSRVCSSQSDLGVAVLRTAKLSYYISSVLLAAAPLSPDLAPDCTEQHWHQVIPPTSICCDSNQSFISYFNHPYVYEHAFSYKFSLYWLMYKPLCLVLESLCSEQTSVWSRTFSLQMYANFWQIINK